MYGHMLPPPEFDHAYHGQLTVEYLYPAEVHQKCARDAHPSVKGRILGCAYVSPGKCHVIVIDDPDGILPLKWHDALMRHELGHCNGWRHTYPRD